MVLSAFFAFLHFVAVFGIFGALFLEWLVISEVPTLREARRIQLCDRWYGIFAAMLLAVGLLRVYYFEKGSAFYFSNAFFNLKLALFLVLGLISIYPTVRFIAWRRSTKLEQAPVVQPGEFRALLAILRLEMALLLAIALCASLMARGIALRG